MTVRPPTRFLDTIGSAGAALMGQTRLVGWLSGGCFMCVVAALTLGVRAHDLPLTLFAASSAKIAAGELWLLPASALVIDRPVIVGLVTFGLLGFAMLRICGAKVFWIVAVAGHIGSTLAAYAIIGASRLADPDVFTSAAVTPDFGVSAVQGAWVGAIAATLWSRAATSYEARALVVFGVCALAAVAWWLHPDPSILTTEHLFALLIGCSAIPWPRLAASARAVVGGLALSPRQDESTSG